MATSSFEEEDIGFPDRECRIILMGKTGNGKSSTGNTILGRPDHFEVVSGFSSGTSSCQRGHARRFGVDVEVVDTPGFFSTELEKESIQKELLKCLGIVSPGPHAFVVVFRFKERFTEQENKTIEQLIRGISKEMLRYLIIVFTHCDDLQSKDGNEKYEEMKNYLEKAPKPLANLLKNIDQRFVLFDNEAIDDTKDKQVKLLLKTIKELHRQNKEEVFKHLFSETIEQQIKKREDELPKQASVNENQGQERREKVREEIAQEKGVLSQLIQNIGPALNFLSSIFQLVIAVLPKKA